MRDISGRDVAREGDTTDHGGTVTEGASDYTQLGIPVALDGHLVECPKCGGTYPIIATGSMTHKGKRVAYLGDKTACGAVLMRRV
ncbi:PAAR motif protein [Caballeronia sp. SBC1]|jgi:uncharacterized Zn-binding protein involved in type VI secretion|uniref:PAAR domain-containing protein n=1 Tax=unclassified Caballeronia TaxID=2646786 RepID=UPI0013E1B56B|nr:MULTISPECIES: PAAR domain-containing protein [unclassified Caballeronia]QIE22388.1 PAAR motif protein [Caballeronia sp. SBC2]QIN60457.1 PAAR motif protein [Caballeronia sp. SBC1]